MLGCERGDWEGVEGVEEGGFGVEELLVGLGEAGVLVGIRVGSGGGVGLHFITIIEIRYSEWLERL